MPVESANFISQLNASYPVGASDFISQGDDQIRGIKTAVQGSFPNLGETAVTANAVLLNYTVGLTGNIQLQLNGSYAAITSANAAIASANAAIVAANAALATTNTTFATMNTTFGTVNTSITTAVNTRPANNGTGATGTWPISISGAAASATVAGTITSQGALATKSTVGNGDWSGGNNAIRTVYISTGDPSGGSDGDFWFKYTP